MLISLQLEACAHPFFDDLRGPNMHLPNGRPLPPLFDFKPQGTNCQTPLSFASLFFFFYKYLMIPLFIPICAELANATPELLQRLIPEHYRK